MLRDLKLGTRVRAGFGAVIAMIVAMAVLCLVLIASQQRHATALHAHRLLPLQRLALISDAYADATIRSQLATADREWRAYTARPAEGAERALVDWQVRAAAQDAARATAAYRAGRNLIWIGAPLMMLFCAAMAHWTARHLSTGVSRILGALRDLQHRKIPALRAGAVAMASGELDVPVRVDVTPIEITHRDEIGALAEALNSVQAEVAATAVASERSRETLRALLGEANSLVRSARAGDLRKLNAAINDAVSQFAGALADIELVTIQVSTAAAQVSAGSQSLADGSNSAAVTLQEISGRLQELDTRTRESASNADRALGSMEQTRASTKEGVERMADLSTAIAEIRASAEGTAKILRTIEEIAFQTNLLALNAAVEAARAGDAGRGFAVVADEVRALALRSAESARQTAGLIDRSLESSARGVALNEQVRSQLGAVNDQVDEVGFAMAEIAAAAEELSGQARSRWRSRRRPPVPASGVRGGPGGVPWPSPGATSRRARVWRSPLATRHSRSSDAGEVWGGHNVGDPAGVMARTPTCRGFPHAPDVLLFPARATRLRARRHRLRAHGIHPSGRTRGRRRAQGRCGATSRRRHAGDGRARRLALQCWLLPALPRTEGGRCAQCAESGGGPLAASQGHLRGDRRDDHHRDPEDRVQGHDASVRDEPARRTHEPHRRPGEGGRRLRLHHHARAEIGPVRERSRHQR